MLMIIGGVEGEMGVASRELVVEVDYVAGACEVWFRCLGGDSTGMTPKQADELAKQLKAMAKLARAEKVA